MVYQKSPVLVCTMLREGYNKFHRQRQLEAGKKESDFDKAVKMLTDGKNEINR